MTPSARLRRLPAGRCQPGRFPPVGRVFSVCTAFFARTQKKPVFLVGQRHFWKLGALGRIGGILPPLFSRTLWGGKMPPTQSGAVH
jgi:hypothetical protein